MMQLSTIFMLGMAYFATAAPNPTTKLAEVVGWALQDGRFLRSLEVTGGCIGSMDNMNGASYQTNVRCRFYRYAIFRARFTPIIHELTFDIGTAVAKIVLEGTRVCWELVPTLS